LQAAKLAPGDEVIFTALNVKGMMKIVKEHRLVPVPVDLDFETMAAKRGALARAITARSKIFIAAHLFGARMNFDEDFDLARRHKLLVVEDCAQAFNGKAYAGHPTADISMFSFGPIKTATALGGALLRINDKDLRARMRAIQDTYPIQPEQKHRKRILQFMGLKLVTSRPLLGLIYRYYRMRGRDYEDAIADRVRDVAPLKVKSNLRFRPSATMLHLLNRRLAKFNLSEIEKRAERGRYLTGKLKGIVRIPALANAHHDFWGFAMVVPNPGDFIHALRDAGFDAATLNRSQHIAAPQDRPQQEPVTAAAVMRGIVVLPCYPPMIDRDLDLMANTIAGLSKGPVVLP
jgi:dTDP-4-amino-4,6-dideoxygalactose transaminase